MGMTMLATALLVAVAVGGLLYVFLYPMISGQARTEKRQRVFVGEGPDRRPERNAGMVNRRDQVAQTLKELDLREKNRSKVTFDMRLQQAGLDWTQRKFLMVSVGSAVALGAFGFAMTGLPIIGLAGLFVGGFGFPRWLLNFLRKRRINQFLEELPNAMDVIVRGLRSGLPLGDCMRIIASEAQEPVRTEFRKILETQAVGVPIGEAVASIYERVPVAEANFFNIVIAIQQKAGGNLSEALSNVSRVLRDRKKMKAKVQAMSMEAKASAGIIGALPFVVTFLIYLTSPAYIELLWHTFAGKVALGASALWMLTGVLVMRKMINFDF